MAALVGDRMQRGGLAEQLFAPLRSIIGIEKPKKHSLNHWMVCVCWLFCFLDLWEAAYPGSPIVKDVRQIPGNIWKAFSVHLVDNASAMKYEIYRVCALAIEAVSEFDDELPVNPFKPLIEALRRETESPYPREVERAMMDAFREERQKVESRIEKANTLADTGGCPKKFGNMIRGLGRSKGNRDFRDEDVLRLIRDVALLRLPNFVEFRAQFGFMHRVIALPPDAMPVKPLNWAGGSEKFRKNFGTGEGLGALYRWFVPVDLDIAPFIAELVMIDGWNLQTALDLDRSHWVERCGPDEVTIFARKSRAGGKYIETKSGTGPNTPYSIIKSAIEKTAPLHRKIVREISELKHKKQTKTVRRRIERLQAIRNRVWLILTLRPIGISHISYQDFARNATEILLRHDVREGDKHVTWNGRRIRDGYIDNIYTEAGNDIDIARDAVHHATRKQTDTYFNHPARKALEQRMIVDRTTGLAAGEGWSARATESRREKRKKPVVTIVLTSAGREWLRSSPDAERLGRSLYAVQLK